MLEEGSTAGSSCWVGALSQLPEADCPSGDYQLFFFTLSPLSLHSHPFTETLSELSLTCRRHTDNTNEISCPTKEPYKPIFLPCQMWAGSPSSRLLSLTTFSSQPTLCVAASKSILTRLHSPSSFGDTVSLLAPDNRQLPTKNLDCIFLKKISTLWLHLSQQESHILKAWAGSKIY